jgi:hypothetical protein
MIGDLSIGMRNRGIIRLIGQAAVGTLDAPPPRRRRRIADGLRTQAPSRSRTKPAVDIHRRRGT